MSTTVLSNNPHSGNGNRMNRKSLRAIAKEVGVDPKTLYSRVDRGIPISIAKRTDIDFKSLGRLLKFRGISPYAFEKIVKEYGTVEAALEKVRRFPIVTPEPVLTKVTINSRRRNGMPESLIARTDIDWHAIMSLAGSREISREQVYAAIESGINPDIVVDYLDAKRDTSKKVSLCPVHTEITSEILAKRLYMTNASVNVIALRSGVDREAINRGFDRESFHHLTQDQKVAVYMAAGGIA